MTINRNDDRREIKRLKQKAETYLAIIFAFVGLVAEILTVRLMLSSDEIPQEWHPLIWAITIFFPFSLGLWFLVKATSFPTRIRNRLSRIYLTQLTRDRYSTLVNSWVKYVKKGKNPNLWSIRAAIAKEYVIQEKDDLSGHGDLTNRGYTDDNLRDWARKGHPREGRPLIITNFLRYSQLVESLVNASLRGRKYKDTTVICITTLNMSLEKWFNFDDKAHCMNVQWDGYLEFLQNLLGKEHVILSRILLTHQRDKPASNSRIALRSADELSDELKSWIWLQKRDLQGRYNEPLPMDLRALTPKERREVFASLERDFPQHATALIAREQYYADRDRASYLIIPHSANINLPTDDIEGGFSILGEEFISRFHTKIKNSNHHHGYFAEVDPKIFIPIFTSPFPPPPSDLFYVGLVQPLREGDVDVDLKTLKNRIDPLFCIAARTDEAIHHVAYLSLLDEMHCPKNLQEIQTYLNDLIENCRPLKELM